VIKPVLPASSAINGNGYQLLVRGDEQTHAQVKLLLDKLDSAPRNLVITVSFTSPTTHISRNSGAEVRAKDGDVSVRAGDAPRQGAEVQIGSRDAKVRLSDKTVTTNRDDNNQYKLRVLEGNTAFIQTGEAIPYGTQTIYPGGATQNSVQFRQTQNGFIVRPRINGDRVLLDILPSQESPSPQGGGRIDTQKIQTTVAGKLGEWIELGSVSSSNQQENSGTLYSTRQQRNTASHIFLKVDADNN
jgi:type II secretory pathway component GspD/PulD (secretin)